MPLAIGESTAPPTAQPLAKNMGKLKAGYVAVALHIQEAAAGDLSNGDVVSKLSNAVRELYANTGHWGYYVNHFGDGESGDVIYSCDGQLMRCPYSITQVGDTAATATLDTEAGKEVSARTIYEDEPEDDDHYTAMEEAYRANALYTALPLYERFISKDERTAADASDFAGKGKSFPILKPGDVMAAVRSMGRAGPSNYGTATIKANIIRIAKRKGWSKYLPQAWQDSGGDTAKEAAAAHRLTEAAKLKDCADCEGDGKCPKCNGLTKAGTEDCAKCKGSGDCPACDGKGKVPIVPPAAKESAAALADLATGLQRLSEAGARHSADDVKMIQSVHDTANALGANCSKVGGTTEKESAGANQTAGLRLVESDAAFCSEVKISEAARTNYPIRVISPGTGTTAHYPTEALKKEAAKFKPGTLMFWNHPTSAEERERPEGNLDNLAAILTSQGQWKDDGPKGAGIYAEAKVMADYAQKVEERAPHIGLSIRAGGIQDGDKVIDGKPVLKEFSYIESVDYVTKAGRGGLALAEAARNAGVLPESAHADSNNHKEDGMDDAELKALKESVSAQNDELKRLREDRMYATAFKAATKALADVDVHESVKTMIVENVIGTDDLRKPVPRTATGELDTAKLKESVDAEAKRVGAVLSVASGSGRPFGLGGGTVETPTAEQITAREVAKKHDEDEMLHIYESIMGRGEAATLAAKGRAA